AMNDPAIVLSERSTVPPARAIVASPISVPRIAGPTTSATTGDESPTTPVTTASVPTTTPITPIPLARAIRITEKLRTFGGGTPAGTRVRIQGELRHDECLPADVEQCQVRLSGGVVEDPQLGDPSGQRVGRRLVIVRAHAEQDDQSAADLADDLLADADPCARRPLEERAHPPAARSSR